MYYNIEEKSLYIKILGIDIVLYFTTDRFTLSNSVLSSQRHQVDTNDLNKKIVALAPSK